MESTSAQRADSGFDPSSQKTRRKLFDTGENVGADSPHNEFESNSTHEPCSDTTTENPDSNATQKNRRHIDIDGRKEVRGSTESQESVSVEEDDLKNQRTPGGLPIGLRWTVPSEENEMESGHTHTELDEVDDIGNSNLDVNDLLALAAASRRKNGENVGDISVPPAVRTTSNQDSTSSNSNKRLLEMEVRCQDLERTIVLLREENEAQRRDREATAQNLVQVNEELEKSESMREQIISQLWEKTQEVSEAMSSNAWLKKETNRQSFELASTMVSMEKMTEQLDTSMQAISDANAKISENSEQIADLQSANESLADEFQKVVISHTAARKRIAELEADIAEVTESRNEAVGELKAATEREIQARHIAEAQVLEDEMLASRMKWAQVYAQATSPKNPSEVNTDAASEALERLAQIAFSLDEIRAQQQAAGSSFVSDDPTHDSAASLPGTPPNEKERGSTSEGLNDIIAADMKVWQNFVSKDESEISDFGPSNKIIFPLAERLIACLMVRLSHVETECEQYKLLLEEANSRTVREQQQYQNMLKEQTKRDEDSRKSAKSKTIFELGHAAWNEMLSGLVPASKSTREKHSTSRRSSGLGQKVYSANLFDKGATSSFEEFRDIELEAVLSAESDNSKLPKKPPPSKEFANCMNDSIEQNADAKRTAEMSKASEETTTDTNGAIFLADNEVHNDTEGSNSFRSACADRNVGYFDDDNVSAEVSPTNSSEAEGKASDALQRLASLLGDS